jgi:Rad3-related DNA helicase
MKLTRAPQQRYGQQVRQLLTEGGHAALEGPCGLGKSWGYLVPALEHSERTLITTSSLGHLNQLRRDLEAHADPDDWCVLKGHASYLCIDDDIRADLALHYPDWSSVFNAWERKTKTGEIRDELPSLPDPILDLLTCDSLDCRDDDCWHKRASSKASEAKLVLVTHHNILTRLRWDKLDCAPLGGDGEDAPEPITSLIIDECHLLENAVDLTYADTVPLYDPNTRTDGALLKECTRKGSDNPVMWFAKLGERILASQAQWQRFYIKHHADARKIALRFDTTFDALTALSKKALQRQGLTPAQIAIVREASRAKNALAKLDRAQQALLKTDPAGRGRMTGVSKPSDHITLTLRAPHPEYLDIQDGKLVLRQSDPSAIISELVDTYQTTILTSATVGRVPANVEITRYPTPFNLPQMIELLPMSSSCPKRGVWSPGNTNSDEPRRRYIAARLINMSSEHKHVLVLVTSKSHAKALAAHIPGAVYEREEFGPDKVAKAIESGGIGIWYTWHGWDLPSRDKVLFLERMPWAAPSRAWAALKAVSGLDAAQAKSHSDIRQRVLQGYGRAIRSATDRCVLIRGEPAFSSLGLPDPRRTAEHEAA